MENRLTRVGLIQSTCGEKPAENINNALHQIENAASKGANIICLQELFTTTYFCSEVNDKYFDYAEVIPGPLSTRFQEVARKNEVVLILPYFERATAGIYFNSAVVIDADGSYLGKYRKMHIPDDPGFYEKYYFTPGDSGYKVFKTKYGKLGILICWDQWFPEAARIASLQGAEIIFYPTAIGTLPDENEEDKRKYSEAWETIQRSHAIANGSFVASVNRVGNEGKVSFWGQSFIAGPFGEILAKAGNRDEIILADCDLNQIESVRRTWPFFRDRRIDSYDQINKRYLENQ